MYEQETWRRRSTGQRRPYNRLGGKLMRRRCLQPCTWSAGEQCVAIVLCGALIRGAKGVPVELRMFVGIPAFNT
jgi:hypothetical protein